MKWQPHEDRICCEIFFENQVFNSLPIMESVEQAINKGVNKSTGSIKMKFSNIASLCDSYGICLVFKIGRLHNFSEQNRNEFIKVMDSYGVFK